MQVRGLGGEDRDALVEVPVGSGRGVAEIAGEPVDAGTVAEPAQDQHRLAEASQRPDAPWGSAPAALGLKDSAEVPNECAGDI
ncbi:hypothetical protein GCM10009716_49250 [Streptomyces sodiiphilus]|uniref:Uncharacterized protein n=1 Tax=Streptomyces sodiiphilus TaxID=226217 RepID=A0ABN2Q0B3_9ACTN